MTFVASMASALSGVLDPLRAWLASPEGMRAMLRAHGWEVDTLDEEGMDAIWEAFALDALIADVDAAVAHVWDGGEAGARAAAGIFARFKAIAERLKTAGAQVRDSLPYPLDQSAFWSETVPTIPDGLVCRWLREHQPAAYGALIVFGVAEARDVKLTAPGRRDYRRYTVHWDRLDDLVTKPDGLLLSTYGVGSAHGLSHETLLAALQEALTAWGVGSRILPPQAAALLAYYDAGNAALGSIRELRAPFVERGAPGDPDFYELGLSLLPIPANPQGKPAGVALQPVVRGSITEDAAGGDAPGWTVEAGGQLLQDGSIAIELLPGDSRVRADVPHIDTWVTLTGNPGQAPWILAGTPAGDRVELGGFRGALRWRGPVDDVETTVTVGTDPRPERGLALVFQPSEDDGFLRGLLGGEPRRLEAAVSLSWSSRTGLSLGGSAGLTTTIPLNRDIGIVHADQLTLGLGARDGEVWANAGASGTLTLGPVRLTVDGVGIALRLVPTRPGQTGTFGDLDLRFGFSPPTGIGIAVEAPGVTGGGFLAHDEAQGRYTGALQLEIARKVAVQALGVLETRVPGHPDAWSLLVLISAEFPPVQLGFGFTLNAVGGLIGIHRRADVDALRAGLQAGSLDSVLFPKDVVKNAPRLVNDLSRLFPSTPGRYLFGPMARLAWGTPTLVTLDLALALEVPDPVRLMVLGRMKMALPDPKKPVVLLQMDVLGVIDFARGDLAIDATLRGSRIASFPISGDMAVRASWGRRPLLIAAAGGFNPRFAPPPGFPRLERLAIQLATGNNPRVRLEAYLALTSNTVQFGARLDVYFARDLGSVVGTFSVEAALGFDALVQFDPFGFVVDIHAHAALRRNGSVLLGLTLDFMLAGPGAWHVKGTATFHFLGKHTIGFEKRFGGAAPPRLPRVKADDVRDRVVAALADGRSWSAELPAGSGMLVTLRPTATADGVLVHPLGRVTARQRVAPLGVTLQRHGAAELDAPRALRVQVTSDGARVSPVRDFFAPADHFALSDDQKLSRPSFEELVSGVQVGSDTAEHGPALVAELAGPLAYDTTVMDPDFETWKAGAYAPTAERLAQAAAAGAVARAHDARASRFAGPALDLRVRDAAHAVVAADTLAPVADPDGEDEDVDLALSFTEALEQRAYLEDKLGRRLMVVGAHEVGA